ncbi:PAS domain-containing sensor histidine kinase [Cognatishimia sp. F0-27]|uniref:sensor histidine kinase n=1 Tax=Cognatishimia sp. F0-27 TaxID=2816855 RepID=UPI001D0C0D80|nr:PAS domain-containing sensor histidine kinase [Cognatishimia sp. F0-27]MCC1491710.1 PAS domain-containing protein [Cognatishimia sp. F0-27]
MKPDPTFSAASRLDALEAERDTLSAAQSEAILPASERALMDSFAHAAFVLYPDTNGTPRYIFANRHALDELGMTLGFISGLTAQTLYPGLSGRVAMENHRRALQSGTETVYELTLPLKGRAVRLRTTLVPQRGADGTIRRVIGTSVKVTLDKPVSSDKTCTETRVSAIQDFITLAAHDLRAPMGQIQSLSDLLLENFSDLGDGKRELVKMIQSVAIQSQKLITDVLSHAQAIEVSEEPTAFSFRHAVQDVMKMLDPAGRAEYHVSSGEVLAEAQAVQIVLRNLVDNALKHACADPEQSGTGIRLDISLHEHGSELFGFSVRDYGRGFSTSAAMFLESGRFKTESGFGLLGIRRMVESRGGSISATNSADGAGAVVTVLMPGRLLCDPGALVLL